MPFLIQSYNCLSAWKDACSFILKNGDGFNLLVQVDYPLDFTQEELTNIIDTDIISLESLKDVINTIFPVRLYERNTSSNLGIFYDKHEKIYLRGKNLRKKNRSRWGTYFLRFTRFGVNKINQLQKIIDAMNSRNKNQTACYIMHVSSIDCDNNTRPLGNPCLQYVQFGMNNGVLDLTAVYRNHDFLTKALGNYIGLAHLLKFVCEQTITNGQYKLFVYTLLFGKKEQSNTSIKRAYRIGNDNSNV